MTPRLGLVALALALAACAPASARPDPPPTDPPAVVDWTETPEPTVEPSYAPIVLPDAVGPAGDPIDCAEVDCTELDPTDIDCSETDCTDLEGG